RRRRSNRWRTRRRLVDEPLQRAAPRRGHAPEGGHHGLVHRGQGRRAGHRRVGGERQDPGHRDEAYQLGQPQGSGEAAQARQGARCHARYLGERRHRLQWPRLHEWKAELARPAGRRRGGVPRHLQAWKRDGLRVDGGHGMAERQARALPAARRSGAWTEAMTQSGARACGELRIGISGWRYPSWRGAFYPPGLPQRQELAFAAQRMNSIEINGSFYSLLRPELYAAWHRATPDDFSFAVKGSRFITHMKKLRGVETALANFFASGVFNLGHKFGPFLWQFP